jgi:hypothetical protein
MFSFSFFNNSLIEGCEPTYLPVGLSKLDGVFGEKDIGGAIGC